MVADEIVEEEEEIDAPGVSEVCAIDKDSGNGIIPEVSPEFLCRVVRSKSTRIMGPYQESQKSFVGFLRSERTR